MRGGWYTSACGVAAAAGSTRWTACSHTSAHSISRMYSSPVYFSSRSCLRHLQMQLTWLGWIVRSLGWVEIQASKV